MYKVLPNQARRRQRLLNYPLLAGVMCGLGFLLRSSSRTYSSTPVDWSPSDGGLPAADNNLCKIRPCSFLAGILAPGRFLWRSMARQTPAKPRPIVRGSRQRAQWVVPIAQGANRGERISSDIIAAVCALVEVQMMCIVRLPCGRSARNERVVRPAGTRTAAVRQNAMRTFRAAINTRGSFATGCQPSATVRFRIDPCAPAIPLW
jgi:hypothetical protein